MIKKFEKYIEIPSSELGNNWSADYYINKKDGKLPFVIKDKMFVPVDTKKTIPVDAVYLKPIQVVEYNKLSIKVKKLMDEQKRILDND